MKKSFCPACTAKVAFDAVYCSKCGADINPNTKAYFCIRCGLSLDDDANYCAYCREPVPYASDRVSEVQTIADVKSGLCFVTFAVNNNLMSPE